MESQESAIDLKLKSIETDYQQKISEVVFSMDVDMPEPYHLKRIMSLIVNRKIDSDHVFDLDPNAHIGEIYTALDDRFALTEIQSHNVELLQKVIIDPYFESISKNTNFDSKQLEKYNQIHQILRKTIKDNEQLLSVLKSQPKTDQ